MIASCALFTAAASSLLPDFCLLLYMCFLLPLFPSLRLSSLLQLYVCLSLFHPIISAVTPPPNISPTLSPPSLDYPLCFFATLLEFNAVVHQFCPGSLALTFIVPQSPLMLFFFPLFLFFSLCMKFRYITFSHHQFTKKAVC